MTETPRRETAEEQLLRMIEGARGSTTEPVASTAAVSPWQRLRHGVLDLVVVFRTRWRLLFGVADRGDVVLRNFQLARRALWIALAGLGAYVIVAVVAVQPQPPALSLLPPEANRQKTPGSPSEAVNLEQLAKPLAEYLAVVLQRNPFTGESGGSANRPAVRNVRQRLEELASGLVVVGINRGASPEALIEDPAHQHTYFVKVGDEINGMIVKEINAKGVIVGYEGEEELLQ